MKLNDIYKEVIRNKYGEIKSTRLMIKKRYFLSNNSWIK